MGRYSAGRTGLLRAHSPPAVSLALLVHFSNPQQRLKTLKVDNNDPNQSADDATIRAFLLYQQHAKSMLSDAESWLQGGDLDHAISEVIPDALLICNEAGIVVQVNQEFELMFGYHRTDIIGQSVEMLLPDETRLRHVEQRRAFSYAPGIRAMSDRPQLPACRKNGDLINVMIKLGPVVSPAGTFIIAIIRRSKD